MEEEHQDLDKPIYGAQSREEAEELTNQNRDYTCYYSLRENPKKKTQESPEPMKKVLFRCDECGKGFRYEKCYSNHQAVCEEPEGLSTNQKVYEESIKSLCDSFSFVRKKKRSRLIRYKKTSFSCSFLQPRSVFAANDEELEVADCLILLSKSTPKFVDEVKLVAEAVDANPETPKGSYESSGCLRNKKLRKGGEFESGVLSNEQRLLEEGFSSYETPKELASFLGDSDKLDQQIQRKAGEFESGFLSNELEEEITTPATFKGSVSFLGHKCLLDQQKLRKGSEFGSGFLSNEQKLMEETCKEPASFFVGDKHELDQQKLCKAGDFGSGFYRSELGVGAMECTDSDTEMITQSDKKNVEHQCRSCNKIFSSYQALGGHQTCHRMSKCKNKKNGIVESV